jgi:type II secretory pathway pseudopilin PulG
MSTRADGVGGFTLVELLIAMAMMVAFGSAVMALIVAGQSMARMQPEAADVQQRARIALQTLGAELAIAGAGLDRGLLAGPLALRFPPVSPSADGGITLWYIAGRAAQTTLAAPFAAGATDLLVQDTGAFSPASTAIVLDGHGCRDVLRIDDVTPASLQVRAGARGCDYGVDAAIGQGEVRTYRVDTSTRQLLRRDEATGSTVPVLDNVIAMTVEYLDGGRRVRITLRLATAVSNPLVPPLEVSLDVMPANLQGL